MAGHAVPAAGQRGLGQALIGGEGAAGPEAAALGRVDGAGRLARELDGVVGVLEGRVGHGDGVDERLRVRVPRVRHDLLGGPLLHDPAQVHDADPVGHVLHDGQVVADEQVGQAQLLLQVLHEVEDLGLDGHVQGGHGLVGDDEVGRQGE